MIKLGVAPRLLDFSRAIPTVIDSWFNQVTVRCNMIRKAGVPVLSEVPQGQWAIFKNTSTGIVSLYVNDDGTLKKVDLT
jgi:hypothetical protein